MRLDTELVNRKLYPTRAKAVAAIAAGLVTVGGVVATKPAQNVAPGAKIVAGALPYLSGRGNLKLIHALDYFGVDPTGFVCLDVGASTGGFTEGLLSRNASRVIAVEIGTDQMITELKNDPRVLSLENTDIRDLAPSTIGADFARPKQIISAPTQSFINLIVIDVSFIPLSEIAPAIASWNAPSIIALIKPQFEVSALIAKKSHGIIKSDADRQHAIDNAVAAFEKFGYKNCGIIESPIKGGSGNTEYLGFFTKI